METNGKNIDDLFKDGLGDYSEMPPPAAWGSLEKKLDVRAKTPNRYYRWLGYFAMVSLLLLLGVSVGRNIAGNNAFAPGKIAANTATAHSTGKLIGETAPQKSGSAASAPIDASPASAGPGTQNRNEPDKTGSGQDVHEAYGVSPVQSLSAPDKGTPKRKNAFAGKKQNKNVALKKAKGMTPGEEGEDNRETDEHIYSSSAKPIAALPSKDDEQTGRNKNKEITNQPKKDIPKLSIDNPDKNVVKKAAHPVFPRFEAGVKAGYETGFSNDAAKKAVISPYVQYNVSPRLSVMLQPAIKSAYISSRRIGSPNSYYQVNSDGKVSGPDSTVVRIPDFSGGGFVDSLWQRVYTYSQSHDSIVKVSSISGSYLEFELPVLLKYRLARNFSVYGGVNIIYSKLISVTENTSTFHSIKVTGYDTTYGGYFAPAPGHSSLNSVITYNGTPISTYTGPQYPPVHGSLLRFGYMLGFSYEYSRKWLFDALVQQGNVSPNVQAGYNINTALSSAYLRLTIGYKITK